MADDGQARDYTHLLREGGKYRCTADLHIYLSGFNRASKSVANFNTTNQLNQDRPNQVFTLAVVVAQLVEQLLPSSEVPGSNPVIGIL